MNKSHSFFPPSTADLLLDDEIVNNSILKLNDRFSPHRLDSPYPIEMLQRWKDFAFQKMVQAEFANQREERLERKVDQQQRDKLANLEIIKNLEMRVTELERECGTKQDLITDLKESLSSTQDDLDTLKIKIEDNDVKFSKIDAKLEQFKPLVSKIDSFAKSFALKATSLEKRISFAIDHAGVVGAVHQGYSNKLKTDLEIFKSEVDQMRADRQLLMRQILQRQDEEMLENSVSIKSLKADKSVDRLGLLESLSKALLEL